MNFTMLWKNFEYVALYSALFLPINLPTVNLSNKLADVKTSPLQLPILIIHLRIEIFLEIFN